LFNEAAAETVMLPVGFDEPAVVAEDEDELFDELLHAEPTTANAIASPANDRVNVRIPSLPGN
jgi:hypothetical protein